MYYFSDNSYDEEYLNEINKRINSLKYIKAEKNNEIDNFKVTGIINYDKVYCNEDWYVLVHFDGNIESFNNSYDIRSDFEIKNILNNKNKIKVKK